MRRVGHAVYADKRSRRVGNGSDVRDRVDLSDHV